MIKLLSENSIPQALEGYKIFAETQRKDGKPYILSMEAGPANGHVRDQGFNFVAKNVFKDKADMEFFEVECEGHKGFRAYLKAKAPVVEGGLMVCWFESGFSYAI
ncbi:hypothetical protein HYALB_00011268 [Hymenoscyphus albidus]|uniref:Stress-response A/B barrel domain-containing protein n=1 Tax=Hymenoscyphus albidus TaxID=595503 RepID=A0A9N9Q9C2_9HELO|nr:hypothetical protein HYALB_00011268 [Hymenoscyphus albidus]